MRHIETSVKLNDPNTIIIVKLLIILSILFLPTTITAYSWVHYAKIFENQTEICKIECDSRTTNGTRPHTLCNPDLVPSNSCHDFHAMKMDYAKIRWILLGYNGLRDRIARTQNVSNMVKLAWDEQLELMAMQWINQCATYDKDECTLFKRRGRNVKYTLVYQNLAFVTSKFLPEKYEVQTLREWYYEGKQTKTRVAFPELYFPEPNNYTIMAWARLERVGCSLGRYNNGIAMVCNYYPFLGFDNVAYYIGEPTSNCSRAFPLKSTIFEHLCAATGIRQQIPPLWTILLQLFILNYFSRY